METRTTIFCAGSIRQALAEAAGKRALIKPGPSGTLKQRILQGARPDIFISADLDHPRELAEAELYNPPTILAANSLVLLLRPGLDPDGRTALELMLDPDLVLGTSTPRADPGGDYAWLVFDLAEKLQPGAAKALKAKAQPLVGGPDQKFPDPKLKDSALHPVAQVLAQGAADLFLGYATSARLTTAQLPGQSLVELPLEINVRAEYGLSLRLEADPTARRLADDLLSPTGRAVLARHGFLV